MSHFGFTYDQCLYEVPYRMLIMLAASVPRYKSKEEKEESQPADLFGLLEKQAKII